MFNKINKLISKTTNSEFKNSFIMKFKKDFSLLLHEYQAQKMLSNFNVATPKVRIFLILFIGRSYTKRRRY